MKVIKMFGDWVRVHLDVREFRCVPLKVNFEVTFCGEPTTAYVALERPLSRVAADVDLEGRVRPEYLWVHNTHSCSSTLHFIYPRLSALFTRTHQHFSLTLPQ